MDKVFKYANFSVSILFTNFVLHGLRHLSSIIQNPGGQMPAFNRLKMIAILLTPTPNRFKLVKSNITSVY